MNKPSNLDQFILRANELWAELSAKVIVGCVACALLVALAFALGYVPDPMLSHGRGSGWECDATKAAAVTCAKDVRSPPTKEK